MNLKNYFIEELGVSSSCWEENEAEIRKIARDSIYSFTKWLYGYEKYDREDFREGANIVGKFRERDLCLSFLAKKLLESEIECRATALESLMEIALESPMVEDYPICGTLNLLREKGKIDDSKFELIVRIDDGFSETAKFQGILDKVVESELENFKKAAIFLRMIDSAKAANRNDFALNLTGRFFEKDPLPIEFRKEFADILIERRFLKTAARIGVFHEVKESLPGRLPDASSQALESLNSDLGRDIAEYLLRETGELRPKFDAERRVAVRWLLNAYSEREGKSFIRKWVGEDYQKKEVPIARGILDFLRENDDVDRNFAKRIVDRLKDANLFQIRKTAFKTGYSIFDDETYIEEAGEDRSKKVRKWASNLNSGQ